MGKFNKFTKPAEVPAEAPVVAEEAPVVEEVVAEVEVKAPAAGSKIRVRAVYGTMIHPFVPTDIRTDSISEFEQVDSWLQSQIDAGKVVVV